jgi:hypothetical protein
MNIAKMANFDRTVRFSETKKNRMLNNSSALEKTGDMTPKKTNRDENQYEKWLL